MKPSRLLAAALTLAAIGGQSAQAMDVRFTGKTRASGKLMADLLSTITGYTKQRYQCSFIFSIDSAMQPAGYEPRNPAYRVASVQRSYERWVVNACGKKRAFFVAFGNNPRGGADYKAQEIPNGVMP
ncbi:hypothetical protein ACO2Q0_19495 [Phenylobacterium sp. VNQ135]|uniref:hypothetical protein n=1 Tax=Phenylobacterium sp. VNQ135 TaxID=3400922 RepID=UPI003BFFE5E5